MKMPGQFLQKVRRYLPYLAAAAAAAALVAAVVMALVRIERSGTAEESIDTSAYGGDLTNSFSKTDFTQDENGILHYTGADPYISGTYGIDVSEHQNSIDWVKVAAAGVKFAMIRVGRRGTTSGGLAVDKYYEENVRGAVQNGIEAGVYFYSQAVSVAEAEEEAAFVLEQIAGKKITGPVAVGMEPAESDSGRTKNVTTDVFTQCALRFCTIIREAGYTPMIYGYNRTFSEMLDMSRTGNYATWIADYSNPVSYPYVFGMWQYSDKGSVDGIGGRVDLDIRIMP
jgi:lysozyme